MMPFCRKVNYSSCNEDGLSEIMALRIRENDRVLCITGSGARTFDLLTTKPAEIISLDFNPCQNYLLELKMRAIAGLSYEEYIEFMGLRPSGQRVEIFKRLRDRLSQEARQYWDRNLLLVRKGVLYQGGWEKYFKKQAILFGLVRSDLLKAMFTEGGLDRQERLWGEVWDSREWRLFLRLVSQRAVWKFAFRDPGFFRYVPEKFSIYRYLQGRFEHAFKNVRLPDSPFASLLFFGRFQGALPLHLQKERYESLRENLHRVRIVTGSLGDVLENGGPNSLDKYSLSDFSSYTDEKEYVRIWRGILKTAAPQARICERQFLVKRALPSGVQPHVRRENDLERELEDTDGSLFYSFLVAQVRSAGHD